MDIETPSNDLLLSADHGGSCDVEENHLCSDSEVYGLLADQREMDDERETGGEDVDCSYRRPWELHRKEYLYTKLKYFRRLEQAWGKNDISSPSSLSMPLDGPKFTPPAHILPSKLFVVGLRDEKAAHDFEKYPQSSLSTVFAIWNTMIGSTLVSLPYAFSTSGLFLGLGLTVAIGAACCYTCLLVVKRGNNFEDFGDLVRHYFGHRAQVCTMICSVFVLVGACVAYHVLMQECLYKLVVAVSSWEVDVQGSSVMEPIVNTPFAWSPQFAALAILVLYPVTNLRNVNVLVTLNTLGIPFVCYTMFYIVYHGLFAIYTKADTSYVEYGFKCTFGQLCGIVTLSFFIHNAIQPIIRNSNPEKRHRDVTIAFILVGLCYAVVGYLGYFGFAVSLNGIEQNFLDSFSGSDVFAFTARASLLLQLATVYPLVLLIVRTQFLGLLLNSQPTRWQIMLLNASVMTVSTCFGIFYPRVGDILRFTGAIGGLFLIFLLPIGIQTVHDYGQGKLPIWKVVFHFMIILVAMAILALQFI